MKKVLVFMLIVGLLTSLVACSYGEENVPHGRYELFLLGKVSGVIVFSGNKVSETNAYGETDTGTFTVDGDKVIITFDNGESTSFTYDKEEDILYHIYGGFVFTKEYGKYYEWPDRGE